jgi:hypothetical protein
VSRQSAPSRLHPRVAAQPPQHPTLAGPHREAVDPPQVIIIETPPHAGEPRSSMPPPRSGEPPAKTPCLVCALCAREAQRGNLIVTWPPESRCRSHHDATVCALLRTSAAPGQRSRAGPCVRRPASPRAGLRGQLSARCANRIFNPFSFLEITLNPV